MCLCAFIFVVDASLKTVLCTYEYLTPFSLVWVLVSDAAEVSYFSDLVEEVISVVFHQQ